MTQHDSNERLLEMSSGSGLAGPLEETNRPQATTDLVFLRVGGRWLAVEAAAVREVTSRGGITRVPTAPHHVLGVMLVRGRLVPVINLEDLIGVTPSDEMTQSLPRVVILHHQDLELGVAVDQIVGVVQFEQTSETHASPSRSAERPAYLRDEIAWQGRLACVLDAGIFITSMAEKREA